jgi:AcrR family transcriptional regulator
MVTTMKRERNRSEKATQRSATKANAAREASAGRERLMETLLNPEYRMMSVTAICRKAGIDRSTYYRAFENKDFVERYKARSKELVTHVLGPVVNALADQAKMGNTGAIKMVLEMAGLYVEPSDVTLRNPPGEALRVDGLASLSVEELRALAQESA